MPTYPGTYRNVPDEELLEKELAPRCDELKYIIKDKEQKKGKKRGKKETETMKDGGYLDFEFEGRK